VIHQSLAELRQPVSVPAE